jgi:hypothetical protein
MIFAMSNAHQTKREIAQKRAQVAHLTEFITDNQLLAFQNVEAGFFASAAGKFQEMADNCEKIHALNQEIQQLSFDLERIQGEQGELHLCGSASGAVLNSPAAA